MFYKRDLYPDLGLMNTAERTIPKIDERAHYKEHAGQKATDIETAAGAKTIPVVLVAMVALLVLLSR